MPPHSSRAEQAGRQEKQEPGSQRQMHLPIPGPDIPLPRIPKHRRDPRGPWDLRATKGMPQLAPAASRNQLSDKADEAERARQFSRKKKKFHECGKKPKMTAFPKRGHIKEEAFDIL